MAQMVGVEKVVTSIDYPILVQGSIPRAPPPLKTSIFRGYRNGTLD